MKKKIGKGKDSILVPLPRRKRTWYGDTVNLADPEREKAPATEDELGEELSVEITNATTDANTKRDEYVKYVLEQIAAQAEREKEQKEKPEEEDQKKQEDKEKWTRYINAFRRLQALGAICGSVQFSGRAGDGKNLELYIPVVIAVTEGEMPQHNTLAVQVVDVAQVSTGFASVPFFTSKEKCTAFISIASDLLTELNQASMDLNNSFLDELATPYRVMGDAIFGYGDN